MQMIERKVTPKKIKLHKQILLTKCCLLDGGGGKRDIMLLELLQISTNVFLRISVIDFASEFWKEAHTETNMHTEVLLLEQELKL